MKRTRLKTTGGPKRTAFKRKADAKGLERGSGPTANPELVRQWIQKSRKSANDNKRAPTPREVVETARVRSGGKCVMCGKPEQVRWPHHPHHVFPVRAAFDSFPELEGEPANVILLCPGCHDNHERAHARVPRAKLPPETVALAEGHPDRQLYLNKTYPGYPSATT